MPCAAPLAFRAFLCWGMRAWSGNRQISSCRLFQQPKHNMPLPRAKTRPAARGNVWTRATASSALSTDSSHATVQPFNEVTQDRKTKRTGAFQAIPMVPNADEHLAAALKRAARVIASSKLKNEAAKARNRASRRMDEVVKAISAPLSACIKGFPAPDSLHPFEAALLDLTIGMEAYQRRLNRVADMRRACVEVGKGYAARTSKAGSKKEAEQLAKEGLETVALVYRKGAAALEGLKDMAKQLRRLPTVDLELPTVALVGAPNVGKSSLVQVLSSGEPEVCDYPFTTRSIKMGHFYVDEQRHQVTDTPGLLNRADVDRNAMERLTVACMAHLPSSVLYVMDLTGQCGTSVAAQWDIRQDLRQAFPAKPWLDVFTKADLLGELQACEVEDRKGSAHGSQREELAESLAPVGVSASHGQASTSIAPGPQQEPEQNGASQAQSISVSAVSEGSHSNGKHETRPRFKWGDRADRDEEKALEVAKALPRAVWVSSLTESGLDNLKVSVLQTLP